MAGGFVVSIHTAPAAGAPMRKVECACAVAGQGLEGDRYFAKAGTYSNTPGAVRDVTLIESEAVAAVNQKLGTGFEPGEMRRNIVTRGVALNHLLNQEFRVGEARLRGTDLCQPCAYLESLTRVGMKAAMQHRCGLRAQILEGGTIRVGDSIARLTDPIEQNKNLIRRFYDELWNPWNFAKADELLSEQIVFRGSLGSETRGRQQFCEYMRQVQRAIPDFHNAIEEVTAEDDRVVARTRYTGTHRGELFGVGPTGRAIEYAGAAFFHIGEGKITAGWVLGDLLSVLRQVGATTVP